MIPQNFKDFIKDWESDLQIVGHILEYLHSYPHLLEKLGLEDLIQPGELLKHL